MPLQPPSDGCWLAHGFTENVNFYSIEYKRLISDAEYVATQNAWQHFKSGRWLPEVQPLLKVYRSWQEAPGSVTGQARLGGFRLGEFLEEVIEDRLISFLLTWRMALDQLASATSSRYGKDSSEWRAYQAGRRKAYDIYFGYRVVEAMRNRVQHQGRPPLAQELIRFPYICEKCGEEHFSYDLDLSVTMRAEWLLESENCPRTLRRDLMDPSNEIIDIREAVQQSMQGFEDILFALLMSSNGAAEHLDILVRAFGETSPYRPVLVKSWKDDSGRWLASLEQLSDVDWVVARSATAR